MDTRLSWVDPADKIEVTKQCELAGVCRATWYNRQTVKPMAEQDLHLCRLLDEAYTKYPFYGSRRMVIHLGKLGVKVNRKRVQRLMRIMGLAGMAPRINDIVRERRAITPDTALRLARYFDTTPEFWLNLQSTYDLKQAEQALGHTIRHEVSPMAVAA
jgi:addiction module HigA family antidote